MMMHVIACASSSENFPPSAPSYLSLSLYIYILYIYILFYLTALQVWVLYQGSHNLVNFPSLAPPLRLYVCTYLALPNWRCSLYYVLRFFIYFVSVPLTPLPTCYSHIQDLEYGNQHRITYLLGIFFNFRVTMYFTQQILRASAQAK